METQQGLHMMLSRLEQNTVWGLALESSEKMAAGISGGSDPKSLGEPVLVDGGTALSPELKRIPF